MMVLEPGFEPRFGLSALSRSLRVASQRGNLCNMDALASADGSPQGRDFGLAERAKVTDGQGLEADGAYGATVQVGEPELERATQPADLMMFAAVERQLELRVLGCSVQELGVFRAIITWAGPGHREPTRIIGGELLIQPQPVLLVDVPRRLQHGIGQLSVGREQQEPRGFPIQSANGKRALGHAREPGAQISLPQRISRGRGHRPWFVELRGVVLGPRKQPLAVQLDRVTLVNQVVQFERGLGARRSSERRSGGMHANTPCRPSLADARQ